MKRLLTLLVVLILVGAGVMAYRQTRDRSASAFQTAAVQRGDLLVTISATGTVEPEEVVDVGAQVAGKIEFFGEDKKKRRHD
jgi:HlyD family secretion protein